MKVVGLDELFQEFERQCNRLTCPTCRSFCRYWITAGRAVYLIVNEDEVDDGDVDVAVQVIEMAKDVLDKHKNAAAIVVNE